MLHIISKKSKIQRTQKLVLFKTVMHAICINQLIVHIDTHKINKVCVGFVFVVFASECVMFAPVPVPMNEPYHTLSTHSRHFLPHFVGNYTRREHVLLASRAQVSATILSSSVKHSFVDLDVGHTCVSLRMYVLCVVMLLLLRCDARSCHGKVFLVRYASLVYI